MRGSKGLIGRDTNSLNFWQKKLLDHGMTLHSIAEAIGVSYRYTVAYFTGFVHPTEPNIKSICDILEVPIDLGTLEFDKLFEFWGNAHKDAYTKFGNTYKRINKSASNSKKSHNKMNFWQHKISGQGISIKELAILLDKPYSMVKAYFTGATMPSKETIIFFSKKFNVDYDRAYNEFEKIHNLWVNSHTDIYETNSPNPDNTDYLRKLYGELSYSEFNYVMTSHNSYEDMMRYIYGKVGIDCFNALIR